MLFSGRVRADAQAAACEWLSAAPSLRFLCRLLLLLGASFITAVLLGAGPADAAEDSGPPSEVSVSSGIESQPVAEPTLEPVAEPVAEPTPEPVVEPTPEPTPEPVVEPTPEPSSRADSRAGGRADS